MSRFDELIQKMKIIHTQKDKDYSGSEELGNLKACQELGISPYVGVIMRISDKHKRICNLVKTGLKAEVDEEKLEDSLMDMAIYCILAIILYEERVDANLL